MGVQIGFIEAEGTWLRLQVVEKVLDIKEGDVFHLSCRDERATLRVKSISEKNMEIVIKNKYGSQSINRNIPRGTRLLRTILSSNIAVHKRGRKKLCTLYPY